MPLIKRIRHSPLYLYLKFYTLSSLISIFTSAPVSRRLSKVDLSSIEHVNPQRSATRVHIQAPFPPSTQNDEEPFDDNQPIPDQYPKTLISDSDQSMAGKNFKLLQTCKNVYRRWKRRLKDLDEVKRVIEKDQNDTRRYPELLQQAKVRCSGEACQEEIKFVQRRLKQIADSKVFRELLQYQDTNNTRAEDIPTVAIGGSGGGYRATFGFISSLQALQSRDYLDLTHWLAGVSDSCWSLAAVYTIGKFNAGQVPRHYKDVAREGYHPMSRRAFDTVARSSKGVYFLLAPLLSKLQSGVVGIGVMDMYATLTSTYQLLSRSSSASTRLSCSTFEFSKWWNRLGMAEGKVPMPIFTAVRVIRRRKDAVAVDIASGRDSPSESGVKKKDALVQSTQRKREDQATTARQRAFPPFKNLIKYQWWKMNPLEIGSSDEEIWIPSWSYGRTFLSGQSITTNPEISMSLLLGQVTSAPAGPLTGYISTLLATIPKGTIMSYLLSQVNSFVLQKRWENRWGNPIRGADEPSPLYGKGKRSNQRDDGGEERSWEAKRRMKLMDSGLSNNLPNPRKADIIISFDFSSDVQNGSALSRIDDFARQRQLIMVPERRLSSVEEDVRKMTGKVHQHDKGWDATEIQKRFQGQYAQVFQAWYKDQLDYDIIERQMDCGLHLDKSRKPLGSPHMHLIYCPLLPHPSFPEFDPATASFSTNYNLIWSPQEIETIHKTAYNNAIDYIIPTLIETYRKVYNSKRLKKQKSNRASDRASDSQLK